MPGNARAEKMIVNAFNPDLDRRTAAILAAGPSKTRSIATSLCSKLDDKELQVAFAAAITLSKMNDRPGEDILTAVVDGGRKASAGLVNSTMQTLLVRFLEGSSPMPDRVALFRRLALSLPDVVESAHMGHPDFRLNTRIFATLSRETDGCGVLMLTPEQQAAFSAELSEVFEPVPGGWGRSGSTLVHLAAVQEDTLLGALTTAYRNIEAKQGARKRKPLQSKL